MSNDKTTANADVGRGLPEIRDIGTEDVKDAIAKGIADFHAHPTHYIFLGIIYPIVMLVIARVYAGYDVLPLVFPILAGSTLLGPLAACGMYEMSRRREQGLHVTWLNCFDVFRSPSIFSIAALGLVLGVIFLVWLVMALGIYWYLFGTNVPESIATFVNQIFYSGSGWALIILGSGVGFLFSVLVLTISIVSFPMLIDRHCGVTTAVLTSVRSVVQNPKTIAVWGLIVAGTLLVGALPFFVGLAVVMPVLGHATWHLYRKIVVS